MRRKFRVLVVDDSPFVCKFMGSMFSPANGAELVGTALSGRQALEMIRQLKPDVVTLDVDMPEMNGIETLQHIMRDHPTPVVMVSGVSRRAALAVEQSLKFGAVDFVFKHQPGINIDTELLQREIHLKVSSAAWVRVVRSLEYAENLSEPVRPVHLVPPPLPSDASPAKSQRLTGVIVIGASTGGIIAIQDMLSALPHDFSAAVLVVQHVPAAFTSVVATQLARHTSLPVAEAKDGEILRPGTILVAPGNYHLTMRSDMRMALDDSVEVRGHKPCIDVTMQSVAAACGAFASGVVLTGMGEDGSQGLADIKAAGGQTFAQLPDTCLVQGMPLRAIQRGAASHVGAPSALGLWLKVEHAARARAGKQMSERGENGQARPLRYGFEGAGGNAVKQ